MGALAPRTIGGCRKTAVEMFPAVEAEAGIGGGGILMEASLAEDNEAEDETDAASSGVCRCGAVVADAVSTEVISASDGGRGKSACQIG